MNTRRPQPLLTTFLTAFVAVAASAVLGLNLADQAETQQKVEMRAARVVTAQTQTELQKLPTVLISGRRQA